MKRLTLIIALIALTGCQVPQWRVFQKEIPAPVSKSDDQVEYERQAADLIAQRIEEPKALRPTAVALSTSLGKPKNPIEVPDIEVAADRATARVTEGILDMQRQRYKQDEFLSRYQGLEIENTGVNLFGGSVVLSMAAVVALCVFVPGFGSLILFMIRRIRHATHQVVQGVQEYEKAEPEKYADLQEYLRGKMDLGSKSVIKSFKKGPNGLTF
jgi:hypothetical protein